jgi:hypothetical protein
MKRNRTIRRTTVARKDAAHRWDQAYLHLLRWVAQARQENQPEGVDDARSDLRPGFDPAPGTSSED